MRYIIYGAGAVGGAVGGKLHMAGFDVVLIARGEHLRVLKERGLELRTPEDTHLLPIPAVGNPSEIEFRPDDVVILTMKAQDTEAALEDLRAAAGDQIPVFCYQNGVDNERMAARRFANVYGVMIMLPGTHLEPGVVEVITWPITGVNDMGRYPRGRDELVEQVSRDMNAANLTSRVYDEIMPWKYAKLRENVINVVDAVCGTGPGTKELCNLVVDEAVACFSASGIKLTPEKEFNDRSNFRIANMPKDSKTARSGTSTWQSLARGTGSVEVDFLNGEIVLLGRLRGVMTPANEVFQSLAEKMARERSKPGSVSVEEAARLIEARRSELSGPGI